MKTRPAFCVLAFLQGPKEELLFAPDRLFKVVLVGNSSVGKTSLLRSFCEGRFHPSTTATVGEKTAALVALARFDLRRVRDPADRSADLASHERAGEVPLLFSGSWRALYSRLCHFDELFSLLSSFRHAQFSLLRYSCYDAL